MYSFAANFLQKKFNFDAHYFLRGGFWLSLGQGITLITGIATTALFAHYLSENNYGIYRYLIGLTVIISSFSLTGLGQAVLQTAAKKYYGFYEETLSLNFKYSLSIIFISVGFSAYYWFNGNSTLSIGCLLIALFQPLTSTFQFTQSFLQGSKRFRESTQLHAARMVFISLVSIVALVLTNNILVLFGVYLFSYFFTNIISHILLRPNNTTPTPAEITRKYLTYAKHTSVRNLLLNVAQKADSIVVFTQLGAAELAVYTIATIIPEQIKATFKNFTSLLLPKYANHTDPLAVRNSIPKRSFQLFILLLIITILYILVAPYLYTLLFPKYHEAIFYSQLTALAFPTFVLLLPYSVLQAQIEEKKLYEISLYSSIFQILSLIFFVYTLGLLGAIIAKIVYRIFFLLIVYSNFRKI